MLSERVSWDTALPNYYQMNKWNVVVVDHDEDRLEVVKNTLDVLTVPANGASPVTMNDPDIYGADILVAATSSDETNMISCILAKKTRNHLIRRHVLGFGFPV